ncbi:uncharacterized protein LOC134775096 [Penaeus indicus]|uniref:uncharacterized protein LOC134775096 n=1 Tax=Penaeus indicus TaxID=29960 RepID=UPI00300CDBE0
MGQYQDQEVSRQIGLAVEAMNLINKSIWSCQYPCRRIKLHVFKDRQIRLYGYLARFPVDDPAYQAVWDALRGQGLGSSTRPVARKSPPLIDEVKEAIKDLKNDKSPGADEITAELIKNGGPNIEAFYHKLCCKVWNDQKWPADWLKSVFVPIPKKGNTLQCTNNRTIALISHSSKILLKIIAKRMHWKMKAEIAEEQAGFRAGRGTRNQILNLKMGIEKNHEHNKDLFLCFVDYTKAFDTVAHDILWKNMQDMGFPEHIILLLKSMYGDQKAAVRTTYGLTDWIIAGSMEELQDLVDRVRLESEKSGLFLNAKKTKVMKIRKKPDDNDETTIKINNEPIENVKQFTYLGVVFTDNYDDMFSIATYGAECWSLKQSDRNRIDSFELWCYRRLLRISWTEKKTNEEVLQQINCEHRLIDIINARKLKFIGHILRSDNLDNVLLIVMVFGPRGRGRPKTRFWDDIRQLTGMGIREAVRLAQDRDGWRLMVQRATAGRNRPNC